MYVEDVIACGVNHYDRAPDDISTHAYMLVSHTSPSYSKREKGSGQKGRASVSQRNLIDNVYMM